jgi:hypothetical protein
MKTDYAHPRQTYEVMRHGSKTLVNIYSEWVVVKKKLVIAVTSKVRYMRLNE